ncbi:MAG: 4-alpha-glucanotransferase, partial [Prevotella sp.]|nr:4-alpha-glucanotransferase [Prevotella sp.]
MSTVDGRHWYCELTQGTKPAAYMDYYYSVVRAGEEVRHEWLVEPHRLELAAQQADHYTMYDHWLDIPEDSYMYSSAFTDCIMARRRALSTPSEYQRTVRLKVRAPQLRSDERLAVVGEPALLGAWNTGQAVEMTEHECHEWVVSLDASQLPMEGFEFKFIVLSADADRAPLWEQAMNRSLQLPSMGTNEVVVYELPKACFPISPWKGAGTVIPVFSLRSEGSFGVGDFGDLKLMVDWAEKT